MADGGGDYFSIDAVLAEETAIPCAFQCGAQGIGRALDASSGVPRYDTAMCQVRRNPPLCRSAHALFSTR